MLKYDTAIVWTFYIHLHLCPVYVYRTPKLSFCVRTNIYPVVYTFKMTKPDARESCEEGHLKYGQKRLKFHLRTYLLLLKKLWCCVGAWGLSRNECLISSTS